MYATYLAVSLCLRTTDWSLQSYLSEMFLQCARPDASTTAERWLWLLKGVASIGHTLVENKQMEQPEILTKIHKLLGKLPRTKDPKDLDDDRRKKRKILEGIDDLNQDALVPIEDDAGKDDSDSDPDYKPSTDHTTAPTTEVAVDPKAKVENPCLLETSKVWRVTPLGRDAKWNLELARYLRSLHDNVCGATSAALQRLLVYLFSLDVVSKAAGFAASLRENSDLIAAVLAEQDASKLQPETPFQILGHAIKVLLTSEAKDALSEAEVLSTFANTGRLLHHHLEMPGLMNLSVNPTVS